MKFLAVILILIVILEINGCYAPPVSDAQVATVASRCKELGLKVYVFNGLTSYVRCD